MWDVKTEKGNIELTAYELLNMLMSKVVDKERSDQELLAKTFGVYLQNNQALADISLTQLISMAMEIGYFYRVFNTQNEVVFTEVISEARTNSSDSTSTS